METQMQPADLDRYIKAQQGMSGAHAGGTKGVTQPIEDAEKFRDYTSKTAQQIFPQFLLVREFLKQQMNAGASM